MKLSRLLGTIATIAAVSAAAAAAAGAKPKDDYMAIFLAGKKIGHARMAREVSATRIKNTMAMNLELNRGGVAMKVKQEEVSVETPQGKPMSFRSVQDFGIMRQVTEGTVADDGTVTVKVTSAGKTSTAGPWR